MEAGALFVGGKEEVPFWQFPSALRSAKRIDQQASQRTGNRLVDLERPFNWLHSSQGYLLPLFPRRSVVRRNGVHRRDRMNRAVSLPLRQGRALEAGTRDRGINTFAVENGTGRVS
ncbi:hypothetical protein KM043_006427 [Ampulex compressa]|nr:hypothetical protein KM043_006427 [Ampulex compressa]